ncbi:Microsomal glutathione S-transferase 1 [Trichoplax sp. H2]|nr:Microsomal glutathione S-transferase 1 [Trichoplax sp. H2]|eukprot:RDD44465.1 Microsomal glutathione S-transferase 1 [Trichoplax sp. H2]
MTARFSYDNPVFSCYAFYASILILKMFFVAFATILSHKISEPSITVDDSTSSTKTNVTVERTRRVHLNDLENIPLFLFAGLLYILTDPPFDTAQMYFRAFTAVRILHTIIYLNAIPQPARAIAHTISLLLIIAMTVTVISQASVYL